jgi:peptidoglycan/xylan/chitin deacetylase (PgdA/CDA1 family)/GT2 family glycosyltransferase
LPSRDLLISIVIATRDRQAVLARTLPSIVEQNYPADSFEIVLVDDGSRDGTSDWARKIHAGRTIKVLQRKSEGPASARNAGIAAAEGEFILFLDDDIVCDPDLLREHAAGHADEDGILVHGALRLAPESPQTLASIATGAWYESHYAAIIAEGGLRPDRNVYLNANSSISADAIRDLGGFDEAIPFPREDFELGLRIWKAGIPLRYRSSAEAYEVFTKSSRAFVSDARNHARADIAICRKHPDYRPHSGLVLADPPTPLAAIARRTFRRLPRGSETLLDPSVRVAERLIRQPRARQIGSRLLSMQRQMAFDRAASEDAGSAAELENCFARWLPALLYHRVGSPAVGQHRDLTVSPRVFRQQVGWLSRRGYAGIRPSQWHDWRIGQGELPKKPVLISFDDGYADLAEHALPILRDHGFSAAIFIVSERLGSPNTWDTGETPAEGPRLMTEREVAHWHRAGIEFGAHGRTHRDLSLLDGTDLDDEVRGSGYDLERIIGERVRCFAYPFGSHNAATRAAVSSSYDVAFTADGGVNGLATPPHLLRRTAAGRHHSGPELEWRVWTGSVPFRRIRDRLKLRDRLERLAGS